eukprot:7342920-Alexandrium_andersonii.AAC.1
MHVPGAHTLAPCSHQLRTAPYACGLQHQVSATCWPTHSQQHTASCTCPSQAWRAHSDHRLIARFRACVPAACA